MSTSFITMLDNVYALTNRPDLVNETTLAVQNATLKAHRSDFYPKDLYETGVQFDFALNFQTLEYKSLIPLWRSISYLRPMVTTNPDGTPVTTPYAGNVLTMITPGAVLDDYNINKTDVYYIAGLQLNINVLCAQQYFLLGCYVYPNVIPASYYSWIADEHPEIILYEAAATIFNTIGYQEQAAAYRQMIAEEMQSLKQEIIGMGY